MTGDSSRGKEPKVGMEYIYNLDMAWPIYGEEDTRDYSISMCEKPKEDPEIKSQEELDGLSYKLYSIKVKKGIIVTDVVEKKSESEHGFHLGYNFTIKDSGIRCHCNYPWAFWENTQENEERILQYLIEDKKLKEQEKLVKKLRENIEQLTIKK